MKNLNSRARALMVAVFVFVFNSLLAQKNVGDAFQTANEQLKSTVNGALITFQYICGLGALIGGCMLFYKYVNGDQDASKKTGQWTAGLVIFVVVLQVVKVFFFQQA